MYTLISILIILASILLILVVLVQNSKGGGLAANFTGAGQIMGARKTTDFLEKATWTLAASIVILSLLATAAIPRKNKTERSMIEQQINRAVDPDAIPTLPTALPSQPAAGNQNQGQEDNNNQGK
ncbi:MAG TPA: preprotein translocase subunit SecG [Bacteroidetes bacterium]|nr:preprotein translocase subunit SecG [Bacteroidota bacterium]